MSFVPGLGAANPMSESVCASKPPAKPTAKSCKTKQTVLIIWRKFGTQIMLAKEDIDIIYCKSTKPTIVSFNDNSCAASALSVAVSVGRQDGDFRRARPAAVPDGLQAGEAKVTSVHRREAHFLKRRVVLDVGE